MLSFSLLMNMVNVHVHIYVLQLVVSVFIWCMVVNSRSRGYLNTAGYLLPNLFTDRVMTTCMGYTASL